MSIIAALWDSTGRAAEHLVMNPTKLFALVGTVTAVLVLWLYGTDSNVLAKSHTEFSLSSSSPYTFPQYVQSDQSNNADDAPKSTIESREAFYYVGCAKDMHSAATANAVAPEGSPETEMAVVDRLPIWPRPRKAEWFGSWRRESASSTPTSWVLSSDFKFIVEDDGTHQEYYDAALVHSTRRICGLLWKPPSSYTAKRSLVHIQGLEIVVKSPTDQKLKRAPSFVPLPSSSLHTPERLAVPQMQSPAEEAYTIELRTNESQEASGRTPGGGGVHYATAFLSAPTVAGALNGLETFAQLFSENHSVLHEPLNGRRENLLSPEARVEGTPAARSIVRGLRIEDAPAVAWRGLMVDVARHFLPMKPLLLAQLDAMRAVKMNVLHLHLTDSQSFPLLLRDHRGGSYTVNRSVPSLSPGNMPKYIPSPSNSTFNITNLGRFGAFPDISTLAEGGASSSSSPTSPSSPPMSKLVAPNKSYAYSEADLRLLVREAALRGIRVVPEVDVPAHTLSWARAFPSIVVQCDHQSAAAQSPTDIPALDPSKELTYAIVEAVLRAVADLFPDEYLHVGGDEVRLECWQEDKALMEWAYVEGIANTGSASDKVDSRSSSHSQALALLALLEKRILETVTQVIGKKVVLWEGTLDLLGSRFTELTSVTNNDRKAMHDNEPTSPSLSVQPWKCWSNLNVRAAKSAAEKGLGVIDASCWYLDWTPPWTNYFDSNFVPEPKPPLPATLPWVGTVNQTKDKVRESSQQRHREQRWHQRRHLEGDYLHGNFRSSSDSNQEKENAHLLQGGEAAIWTESVDWTNFECRVWPRAAAVAERLWRGNADDSRDINEVIKTNDSYRGDSDKSVAYDSSSPGVKDRYRSLIALLISRGMNAAPLEDLADKSMGRQQCPPLEPHLQRPVPMSLRSEVDGDRSLDMGGAGSVQSKVAENAIAMGFGTDIRAYEYWHSEAEKWTPPSSTLNSDAMQSWAFSVDSDERRGTRVKSETQEIKLHSGKDLSEVDLSKEERSEDKKEPRVTLQGERVSVLQLNADDGGGGSATRVSEIISWLRSAATGVYHKGNGNYAVDPALQSPSSLLVSKALNHRETFTAPAIAVGLCELNGWSRLEPKGYLSTTKSATPLLVTRAAKAGFAYSHIFDPPGHPYSLGIVARSPIRVIAEIGPPTFERGILHVRLPFEPGFTGHPGRTKFSRDDDTTQRRQITERQNLQQRRRQLRKRRQLLRSSTPNLHKYIGRGLDLVIVHLHAHDAIARLNEARIVQNIVSGLSSSGQPVLVMGDFNTLSPFDEPQHSRIGLLQLISNGTASGIPYKDAKHFLRLQQKYTVSDHSGGRKLAYDPMKELLTGGAGLVDLCILQCISTRSSSSKNKITFEAQMEDANHTCVEERCSYTEPTTLLPDRRELPKGIQAPPIRVDFILANKPFVELVESTSEAVQENGPISDLFADVVLNNHTASMSDHFPVRVQWTSPRVA